MCIAPEARKILARQYHARNGGIETAGVFSLYFCFMQPAPPAWHLIGLLVPVTLLGGVGW
jgi:hypothetical protein